MAMLSPRAVPVAVSGTLFVMALLAMVLRMEPAITMGTSTTARNHRESARL